MKVLCVDDEATYRTQMEKSVSELGHEVQSCNGAKAQSLTTEQALAFDAAVLDWNLESDLKGEAVGLSLRSKNPRIFLVMLTGFGTIERTVAAMKSGFDHYLTKPLNQDDLRSIMLLAQNESGYRRPNASVAADLKKAHAKGVLLYGEHPLFLKAVRTAIQVAEHKISMLLLGESGTGKEEFAKLIHRLSPRASAAFISVNCGAIPPTLIESELFGHAKGAFTGATGRRIGRFVQADGGTLFLDEIGSMSLDAQQRMLRVLQDGVVQPIGDKDQTVDVRVISATNALLQQAIHEGKFREDLFYRLDVVSIKLPPLRERKSDIPILADKFLDRFSSEFGAKAKSFETKAVNALCAYRWPGNVRELENVVRRATLFAKNKRRIAVSDLQLGEDGGTLDGGQYHISNSYGMAAGVTMDPSLPELSILRPLCQKIESTDGKSIENSPDFVLKIHGASVLKDLLAVFYYHYKKNKNIDRFNKLFGCKSADLGRGSVEIKHDLLRFSKDAAASTVFVSKSAADNYGLRDLGADGKALYDKGVALPLLLKTA